MKIKMTTCAICNGLTYDCKGEYVVGETIDEKMANEFLNANFAIVVEEEVKEKKVTRKKGVK